MEPTITCPHCQGGIRLTETIAAPILAAERSKLEDAARSRATLLDDRQRSLEKQATDLAAAEASIAEARAAVEREVQTKVREARKEVALEERAKAESDVEADQPSRLRLPLCQAAHCHDLPLLLRRRHSGPTTTALGEPASVQMQEDLAAEKRATQRQWAKREKQLERMVAETAGLYGDVQGIAGAALPTVDGMELLVSPVDERGEEPAEDSSTPLVLG